MINTKTIKIDWGQRAKKKLEAYTIEIEDCWWTARYWGWCETCRDVVKFCPKRKIAR